MASNLEKVKINFATEEQLQKLTGVGNAVAKNILQHRAVVGNVTLSNVGQIKYLRVTQDFIDQTDFSENPELHIHEDIVEKESEVRNENEGTTEGQEKNVLTPDSQLESAVLTVNPQRATKTPS